MITSGPVTSAPPPASAHKPAVADVASRCADALRQLAANIRRVHGYDHPVLIEGGAYKGIWHECGPHEGLLYARTTGDHAIAIANHDVFFHHQRPDGQLPCWIRTHAIGYAQIQMAVPIAVTALETAELTRNEAFLSRAYAACSRWDAWLRAHRDTRGTGLCEAFCEWDTGHDHSPRFAGLPESCPRDDARICPPAGKLPWLAPDLSATVYGGRLALARMARHLGLDAEAQRWLDDAATLRAALHRHCYHPDDECFYDVDCEGRFIRIRGDALTRVLGEHVVEKPLFERLYARHIRNPAAFWTPFPLPSIAADDPAFDRALPPNSWSGASQALTALRAPRWFDHYGETPDLEHLMRRWIEALLRAPAFMQQMNPWTGEFSTSPDYSPAMLVFVTFARRLMPALSNRATT
ncbi:hypothetical protein OpiT1DRAFT_03478 [Opitutaceae bacterium TAV1]|nr:hypothetical protein OpiT1DRAFT_03478 [Opitutaceae bacterium TAV1]